MFVLLTFLPDGEDEEKAILRICPPYRCNAFYTVSVFLLYGTGVCSFIVIHLENDESMSLTAKNARREIVLVDAHHLQYYRDRFGLAESENGMFNKIFCRDVGRASSKAIID